MGIFYIGLVILKIRLKGFEVVEWGRKLEEWERFEVKDVDFFRWGSVGG